MRVKFQLMNMDKQLMNMDVLSANGNTAESDPTVHARKRHCLCETILSSQKYGYWLFSLNFPINVKRVFWQFLLHLGDNSGAVADSGGQKKITILLENTQHMAACRSVHRVYIWMPRWFLERGGHAAMTLSDGTYISWWPKRYKDFLRAKLNPTLNGIEPMIGKSLQEDTKKLWGASYNREYSIPSERLHLNKMKNCWKWVRATCEFDAEKENCCWVVHKVLTAGGAPLGTKDIKSPWLPGSLHQYMSSHFGNDD